MSPVLDRRAAPPATGGEALWLVPDLHPEVALVDVPAAGKRPTWELPANVVSLWDPEHRDERPCEILPTAERDWRWPIVAVLSAVILGGTVALLALVS